MRVLAAKNSMNLDNLLLEIKRLKIVRHRNQIHFRRKLVGRMPPVTVGENAKLTTFDKADKALLQILEVAHRRFRP